MSAPDYPAVSGAQPAVYRVGELGRRSVLEESVVGLASVGSPTVVDVTRAGDLTAAEIDRAAWIMTHRLAGTIAFATVETELPAPLLEAATVTLAPLGARDRHTVARPDVESTLQDILHTYATNPVASSVFAQTLRLTAQVTVEDGVLAESFAYSTLLRGAEFAAWLERYWSWP
jgi:hypothetical protein